MPIYDFQWVTPEKFDISKVSVSKSVIKNTKRKKILYKYRDGEEPKELRITLPRKEEAYIFVDNVRKDSFQKQEKNSNNTYVTSLCFNVDNKYHVQLFDIITEIVNKFEAEEQIEVKLAHTVKNNGVILYCSLIQSAEGQIFTSFYDSEKEIDVLKYGSFIGRPALSFSGNIETGKIKCQIYQAFAKEQVSNFPLLVRD